MQREVKKYLYDMHEACALVLEFIQGKSWRQYESDACLRSAVERQCQVLGEALWQLDKTWPEVARRVSNHRDIINFRHVLVHGYDKVDDEVVWGIAKTKILPLQVEVERLLSED